MPVDADELQISWKRTLREARQTAGEDELIVAVMFEPQHNAFVMMCCCEAVFTVPQTRGKLRFGLAFEPSVGPAQETGARFD
jgi:hypothetical protein